MHKTGATIAVVGSGYVGLVASLCFAEIGHEVLCVDSDADKIARLRRQIPIIHERSLPGLLARYGNQRVRFTTEIRNAADEADAIFIAVGTPEEEGGRTNLSYMEQAASAIAKSMRSYKLIVIKSTVPVGTSERIRDIFVRQGVSPSTFDVASNPEFLREGSAISDFLHPDRIVVGADSERARELLKRIYEPLVSGEYYADPSHAPGCRSCEDPPPLLCTSVRSAELIKHAANAFLATKISFINMVSSVCEAAGANVEDVALGIGQDKRIGHSFLRAGIGYGGSCFPKDVAAFRLIGEDLSLNMSLLREVGAINEGQQRRFLAKVKSLLGGVRGKRIGVLGLAFKGKTDDIRESPAISVVASLLKAGASISAYDPAAMPRAQSMLSPGQRMKYAESEYEAARDAQLLLILTDWPQFSSLDLARLRAEMRSPAVLDGRNLYSPESMERAGFVYTSIGRPASPELPRASQPQPRALAVTKAAAPHRQLEFLREPLPIPSELAG